MELICDTIFNGQLILLNRTFQLIFQREGWSERFCSGCDICEDNKSNNAFLNAMINSWNHIVSISIKRYVILTIVVVIYSTGTYM